MKLNSSNLKKVIASRKGCLDRWVIGYYANGDLAYVNCGRRSCTYCGPIKGALIGNALLKRFGTIREDVQDAVMSFVTLTYKDTKGLPEYGQVMQYITRVCRTGHSLELLRGIAINENTGEVVDIDVDPVDLVVLGRVSSSMKRSSRNFNKFMRWYREEVSRNRGYSVGSGYAFKNGEKHSLGVSGGSPSYYNSKGFGFQNKRFHHHLLFCGSARGLRNALHRWNETYGKTHCTQIKVEDEDNVVACVQYCMGHAVGLSGDVVVGKARLDNETSLELRTQDCLNYLEFIQSEDFLKDQIVKKILGFKEASIKELDKEKRDRFFNERRFEQADREDVRSLLNRLEKEKRSHGNEHFGFDDLERIAGDELSLREFLSRCDIEREGR